MKDLIKEQAYNLMRAFYPNAKITKKMLTVLETGEANEITNYLLVRLGDCDIQFMREPKGLGSSWMCRML